MTRHRQHTLQNQFQNVLLFLPDDAVEIIEPV